MKADSGQSNALSATKRAVFALKKMRAKLDRIQSAKTEPIAIIGMACRFPGGADTPERFWQSLRDGVDATQEVPKDRWDVEAYYDANADNPVAGKMYTRRASFIEHVDQFDAHFFGISPREAAMIDPQQRLLLEVSWEALERAGLSAAMLRGSNSGVFMGVMTQDYFQVSANPLETGDMYTATGNYISVLAGRLAYALGLHGPTLTVDTACSGSLVAIHLACQSLRLGESDLALAGGVQLILTPHDVVLSCLVRALSPDGRCKTFDASADGYGKGEGGGVLVLKRLSDAERDGDQILALIRGSAVNHDGPSSGLTVPNGVAQRKVIRQALENGGGIEPSLIGYIEAHGTGTGLGDPLEVEALGAVFGQRSHPLVIGSVKTNIGHLEGAAGVAGVIKVALALQHKEIPPHLHFKTPNPVIAWDDLPVEVPVTARPFPEVNGKRLAGISSFGISGTNAHVVLEAAPADEGKKRPAGGGMRPLHLLTLSAKTEKALAELAGRYEQYIAYTHPAKSATLEDICYTANRGRTHFEHRYSIYAKSKGDLREKLFAASLGQDVSGLFRSRGGINSEQQVAFLFTGQGSQYVGMGRQLYESEPTFRQTLERCNEILTDGGYLEESLLSVLYPDHRQPQSDKINQTAYTQPALFALEYALAELWKSWGIVPDVVMGHSVGELVAACVAGVFTLEDGLKLIAERARLMQATMPGEMVAVFASEAQVAKVLRPVASRVSIAAINGPQNVVISGQRQAVWRVVALLERQGIKTKKLEVSHAFHSPLMDPILSGFERVTRQIRYSAPKIEIISNVTGRVVTDEMSRAAYWTRHIREPVRFASGLDTLIEQGYDLLVEIGPKPILLGMARRTFSTPDEVALMPSLRPDNEWQQLLTTLSGLYVRGVSVNWEGFYSNNAISGRKVILPTYPFQRKRYWVEKRETSSLAQRRQYIHPLLGQRLYSAALRNQEIQFEVQLHPSSPAYLGDHRVYGQAILPATAYLEMALAAGEQVIKGRVTIADVAIEQALVLAEEEETTVQLLLTPEGSQQYFFEIFSLSENENGQPTWIRHAFGTILAQVPFANAHDHDLEAGHLLTSATQAAQLLEDISVERFYQDSAAQGVAYGPSFQALRRLFRASGESFAEIELPESLRSQAASYQLHPVLLDACLQAVDVAIAEELSDAYLPVGLDRLRHFAPLGRTVQVHTQIQTLSAERISADLHLFDERGHLVAQIEGLSLRRATRQALLGSPDASAAQNMIYEVAWLPSPSFADSGPLGTSVEREPSRVDFPRAGSWLILTDQGGIGQQIAAKLLEQGESCILVSAGDAYQRKALDDYALNPLMPQEFERLLQEVGPICGVVHLWALDAAMVTDAIELANAQALGCGALLHLVQALVALGEDARLWVVTKGVHSVGASAEAESYAQGTIWGLGRVIAREHPELACVLVDLPHFDEGSILVSASEALFEELISPSQENQIAMRSHASMANDATMPSHQRFVGRLVPRTETHSDEPSGWFRLALSDYGVLDNLSLAPLTRTPPEQGEVEIEVKAVGLNFRDVLNALGMLKAHYAERFGIDEASQLPLGLECVGKVTALGEGVSDFQVGDEVMTLAVGSFASFVTVNAQVVSHKPSRLTVEEAATVPLTYLTAYYGLYKLANLQPGERVLIHAASGGVGQAAVQLAQAAGAEIFATASTGKWEWLVSMGIKPSHIMNSRTLDFVTQVMALTNGEGVHVVLNSLSGDFIDKSFEVLAEGGRFVEIGKLGIWDAQKVQTERPDASYFPFDLGDIEEEQPALIAQMFAELRHKFEQGTLSPLPLKVFPISQVIDAFRYMQQAKHIGKIVISLDRRHDFSRSSYLITGGLGGLGLLVAQWLVEKGARYLVLTGRRGAHRAEQQEAVKRLEQAGAKVVVVQADISQQEEVERVLKECQTLAPLKGIIHAAGVLDDGIIAQQSWSRFVSVMAPKVQGAWHLHLASQNLQSPLDFFVCFSSDSALFGEPGQANYAAANAFMDALAHYRRSQGLPALSINWGAWAEVGMAANVATREQWTAQGIGMIEPAQGLQALEALLRSDVAQAAVTLIDWSRFEWARTAPPFLSLIQKVEPESEESRLRQGAKSLREQLEAAPANERRFLLETHLLSDVRHVLGWDASDSISLKQGFFDLGLDSLTSIELRTRLQRTLECKLPTTLLFDYPTGEALLDYLASLVLPQEEAPQMAEQEREEETQAIERFDDLQLDDVGDLIDEKLADLERWLV